VNHLTDSNSKKDRESTSVMLVYSLVRLNGFLLEYRYFGWCINMITFRVKESDQLACLNLLYNLNH